MKPDLTIGEVARRTGISAKTIRFYEDEGLLPSPSRRESGYRVYSEAEIVRLHLVRRLRLLGLDLRSMRSLLQTAFDDDCARFADQLVETIGRQRLEVDRRIAELQQLRNDLNDLEAHIQHCCEDCIPAESAAICDFCGLTSTRKGGFEA
jgi:MerR family copper efflux transcriptional regulator